MIVYFYIDKQGKQKGPIPASSLIHNGVDASTYVWREGLSTWKKASEVPELKKLFPIMSPPILGPSDPAPPPYYSTHTSGHSIKCPYCGSYNTNKMYGKIIIRYIFVIGAGIVGSLLLAVGSVILGNGAYRATENWDNWKCDSCGKTFKR